MSRHQAEVVPVDTHVHQIAVKHYGMSGSKTKQNMTPALYEQVNSKFVSVWGDYAGWAHSVSPHILLSLSVILMRFQVLFTSDLKSFASYGPVGSWSPAPVVVASAPSSSIIDATTLVDSRSSSPRKRKSRSGMDDELPVVSAALESDGFVAQVGELSGSVDDTSLAERVKRRRRGR